MFTGIITDIGTVESRHKNILSVIAPKTVSDLKLGDSVSVNGVCLTVSGKNNLSFTVDLLDETIKKTNLKLLKTGDNVNLELALRANSRIGGHFVTGHIDGLGRLIRSYRKQNDKIMEIDVPHGIAGSIIAKGSVSIDGVGLTVVNTKGNRFTVHLIPFTMKNTALGSRKTGSLLNIEIDILSRYANAK